MLSVIKPRVDIMFIWTESDMTSFTCRARCRRRYAMMTATATTRAPHSDPTTPPTMAELFEEDAEDAMASIVVVVTDGDDDDDDVAMVVIEVLVATSTQSNVEFCIQNPLLTMHSEDDPHCVGHVDTETSTIIPSRE